MENATLAHAEALANALAMMVAANGRVDERELRSLDQLEAFERISVSRERFVEFARICVRDIGTQMCERSWLSADPVAYINALLGGWCQTTRVACWSAAWLRWSSPPMGESLMMNVWSTSMPWHVGASARPVSRKRSFTTGFGQSRGLLDNGRRQPRPLQHAL